MTREVAERFLKDGAVQMHENGGSKKEADYVFLVAADGNGGYAVIAVHMQQKVSLNKQGLAYSSKAIAYYDNGTERQCDASQWKEDPREWVALLS